MGGGCSGGGWYWRRGYGPAMKGGGWMRRSRVRGMLSSWLLASGESSQIEETINENSTGHARTQRTPPREGPREQKMVEGSEAT